MVQPLPEMNVSICGEAYSPTQWWVEGALESAEILLQKKFGLPAPSWLSAG